MTLERSSEPDVLWARPYTDEPLSAYVRRTRGVSSGNPGRRWRCPCRLVGN